MGELIAWSRLAQQFREANLKPNRLLAGQDLRLTERIYRLFSPGRLGSKVGSGVVVGVIAVRLLSVPVAGIPTNDSIGYLNWALEPLGSGLVGQGYRQFGYPLFLFLTDRIAEGLLWDRLFSAALVQRLLLVTPLLVALARQTTVFVLPAMILSSPSIVVFTNFLLPEGLALGLCVSFAVAAYFSFVARVRFQSAFRVAALLVLIILIGLKLQYAALALPFVTLCLRFPLRQYRIPAFRKNFILPAFLVAFILIFALLLSRENFRELGEFAPVSERSRADWWGAWHVVFSLEPANRHIPELQEFFDGGNLFVFLHNLERTEPNLDVRTAEIEARIGSLFQTAGLSSGILHIESFFGGLSGGRHHDISGLVNRVLGEDLRAPDSPSEEWFLRNSLGQSLGLDEFLTRINDGRRPGVLTLGPLNGIASSDSIDLVEARNWWLSISLALLLLSVVFRTELRLFSASVFVAYCAVAAALATGYIDNFRYLAPFAAVVLIALSANVSRIASLSLSSDVVRVAAQQT